jgi:hypothetical protein
MVEETENLVLALLRQMRSEMADMRSVMATKQDIADVRREIADVRSEVNSLRADVASDLMTLEKRLGDQIAGLRRSVLDYHSSIVGHGALLSELDDRVRRIERHIGLTPETH